MTRKFDIKNFIISHMIEFLLVVLIVCMAVAAPGFLSTNNILNIFRNVSLKGVIAVGMTLVIIGGEIDLSIGSQVALGGVVTAYVSQFLIGRGMPVEYSALIGLVLATMVAILAGIGHGMAICRFRMPSFIITLATQSVMYGLAAIICGGFPIINVFPSWYNFLGTGKLFGFVPFQAVILIIVFIIGWFLMEKTDLGRSIYAVGGNSESARLSGINVQKVKIVIMVAVQLMALLSGTMNSAQVRSATFGFGRGWETLVISAVVIGGASMSGGVGKIWGTFIGIMFTGVISNGMTLLNVNEYMQYVVNGALMFFAVMFNTYMNRARH